MTREQLLRAGLSERQIDWRIRTGRLIVLYPGVYAVGHAALRPEGHRLAAVLAGGRDADLSHRSAAEARGLLRATGRRFEITAPDRRRVPGARLKIYRNVLHPADRTTLDGIPITTVPRTLLDLAATQPRTVLDTALEAAARLELLDLRAVRSVMARNRGRRGVARLRAAIEDLHPATGETRSRLEVLALKLIDHHGLPRPIVNALLHGEEVDLLWPGQRLIVELDGRAHHLTAAAFEDDRRRDAAHLAAGYRTLRFTWRQLTEERGFVATALRAALRDARPPATPPRAPAAAAA